MRKLVVVATLLCITGATVVAAGPGRAHTGYSERSLEGAWGFIEEYRVGAAYGSAVGIFFFDGKGACHATFTEHGGFYATKAGSGKEVPCEYTVDKNGMGRVTGGLVDIAFVITEHGQRMRYIHADDSVKGYYGSGEMERM